MSINETVLEMHYHKPLMDLFRDSFGLGNGSFNFYKYSPQKECFVGFDQAFVETDLSEDELFSQLKSDARDNGYTLSNFFFGYFLQYKVVKIMKVRSRHTPRVITNRPHYRISLDTKKNVNTGLSQHELLYNLNKNIGAKVYYASPMIFDRSDLYTQKPDLQLLRLADVNSCPSIYSDNESHFIYYDEVDSNPYWCSDPVEGEAISPKILVNSIKQNIENPGFYKDQLKLLDNLKDPSDLEVEGMKGKVLDIVHDQLTIIQFSTKEQ